MIPGSSGTMQEEVRRNLSPKEDRQPGDIRAEKNTCIQGNLTCFVFAAHRAKSNFYSKGSGSVYLKYTLAHARRTEENKSDSTKGLKRYR